MTLTVPTIEYVSYYGSEKQKALYRAAIDTFNADVTTYLNTVLPSQWGSYIEFDWQDKDWRTNFVFVLKTRRSYSERRRVFCKIEKGKPFELTAKHIANITEYVNQRVGAEKASQKRSDDLASLKTLLEPVLERYQNNLIRFDIALGGIKIEQLESVEYRGDRLSVTIHRSGNISEVQIPSCGGRFGTTITALEAYIAEYQGRSEALATLAEQIKAELPAEFFTMEREEA